MTVNPLRPILWFLWEVADFWRWMGHYPPEGRVEIPGYKPRPNPWAKDTPPKADAA